jgi:hypothetical protein
MQASDFGPKSAPPYMDKPGPPPNPWAKLMRKRITPHIPDAASIAAGQWLELPRLAVVEVTSEEPSYPIESALVPGATPGWRAAAAGRQTILLTFDKPLNIRRIHLEFEELERPRTQEFALRWRDAKGTDREIVRQQYNFSPGGSTREVEDYPVNLVGATALELRITPDGNGSPARASLQRFLLE